MLRQSNIKIIENTLVAKDTYRMILDEAIDVKCGQFINIKLNNHFLRRPISISKINESNFEILYKVKGFGTKDLTMIKPGEVLDVLLPLGNGFDLVENKKVLLIGGGIGIPPLIQTLIDLKANNEVQLLIGLNTLEENAYSEYNPIVCTSDDSGDFKGNVIEYLKSHNLEFDYIYSCGPLGMLNEINKLGIDGQISIEERMGCGFGACVGCSCKTKSGEHKRICVEGPVFRIGELDLDEY